MTEKFYIGFIKGTVEDFPAQGEKPDAVWPKLFRSVKAAEQHIRECSGYGIPEHWTVICSTVTRGVI